ncbi:MAG: hypothetical protein GY943_05055 [Chloroflexi bacterium]|nr:hypothetical protein [Chloroflexota bacterium]
MLLVIAAILFYVSFVLYVRNRRQQMQAQTVRIQRRRQQEATRRDIY